MEITIRGRKETLTASTGYRGEHVEAERGLISGYVLKLSRETAELAQEGFAERLGVDVSTVQGWESGRRPFTAMPYRQVLALIHQLRSANANPRLLDALHDAAEADYILSHMLNLKLDKHSVSGSPLAGSVMTNGVSQMFGWLILSHEPSRITRNRKANRRRGPVAVGPSLANDERQLFFQKLREAGDFAHSRPDRVLLHRQTCFLSSLERGEAAASWLAGVAERGALSSRRGWSPKWPEVRSLATSLARQGDPELLRAFIEQAYQDDECRLAELNYWAYWVGEISARQSDDLFMVDPGLRWHGSVLFSHLSERLDIRHPLVELNIHTLDTLLAAKPYLIAQEAETARGLSNRVGEMLSGGGLLARRARLQAEHLLKVLQDKE
jgi:transcriptional regulator with XRE-family HTH domain